MAKQTFLTGDVLTAAAMTSLQQTAMGGGSTTAKTTSYTLVAADAGTVVQMNSASATTITVNTALFAAGDTVQIQNIGAGVCTVTAGTATVNTSATLALSQYDAGTLYFNSASAAIFFAVDAASASAFAGCSLYKSSDQSLSNVTTTVITWDSEHYDTNTFHDSINNSRITIPANYGGKYLIQVTLNWNSNATSYREARIRLNGSTLLAYSPIQAAASGGVANTLNVVKTLAVADYIEIQGEQASGGALSVSGGNSYSAQVQVTYLGA
jgi:hypothetical protein